MSDTILFYAKSESAIFRPQYALHDPDYLEKFYRFDDHDGRGRYRLGDMASPNPRPHMMYEWLGFAWPAKGWRYQKDTMQKLHDDGRINYPRLPDGTHDLSKRPSLKRYFAEQEGSIVTNIWTDINLLHSANDEKLPYPTQKPLALLERIVAASSEAGEVVLDPFCGCGTAVHAAQHLDRHWIGIDITHLAISLIEKRLKDAFPAIAFEVFGTPTDYAGASDLALRDKYQFQWWACSLVDAQPYQGKKKGSDGGIDGLIFFQDEKTIAKRIIVSVKGGENVGVTMLKDLVATVQREKAAIGLFVTLVAPTRPMRTEAASAGFYESPTGLNYPRIQILTIEGLLNGSERPHYPFSQGGGMTFKRAKVEVKSTKQRELFDRARSDAADLPLSALVIEPDEK